MYVDSDRHPPVSGRSMSERRSVPADISAAWPKSESPFDPVFILLRSLFYPRSVTPDTHMRTGLLMRPRPTCLERREPCVRARAVLLCWAPQCRSSGSVSTAWALPAGRSPGMWGPHRVTVAGQRKVSVGREHSWSLLPAWPCFLVSSLPCSSRARVISYFLRKDLNSK